MRNDNRLLGVLLIAPFMAQVDVTIANVATPAIHDGLHASGGQVQLVIGGYLISFAMLLITGARIGQAYGYRRAFLAGVTLFTLASLACGLAPDPAVLIAARVLQGAGAAVMFPQTFTGIQLRFTGQARAAAIASYAMALSGGAVTGQVLGGLLVSANVAGLGWRAVFLVNVPVGAAALVAARRYLPADTRAVGPRHERPARPQGDESRPQGDGSRPQGTRLDIPGVLTLSGAVLLIVLPLTLGRQLGWPAWTWLCLAASVPALAAFVMVENRAPAPLVTLRVLAIPVVRWGLIAQALSTGTYYALLFIVAQYVQAGLRLSPVESGLLLVPWVAAFGLAGRVIRLVPPALSRWLPVAGALLLAAAFTGIAAGAHGPALLAPLFCIGGLGLGTQFATLAGTMTAAVPARYAPDISGVFSTVIQIAGAIAVAGVGALYLSISARSHPAHAFAISALVLLALTVPAIIGCFLASRPQPAASKAKTAESKLLETVP
jgi:MFS family permease